jgi:hypothetical protein
LEGTIIGLSFLEDLLDQRLDILGSIPLVCIILLNWNNVKDTLACLEFLEDLDCDHYHVLVVDNGSTNN